MATRLLQPQPSRQSPPPLENGDRLTRAEFERRYDAMPHLKHAELLRGVVYMASPVRADLHGGPHADALVWLGLYRAATAGVRCYDNTTIRLGPESDPQPDIALVRDADHGGQTRIDADGYLDGPPELIMEIAASSVSYDVHVKLDLYREHGVREYVIWRVQDQALDWYVLSPEGSQPLTPEGDGVFRSRVFPGLWLDPAALLAGDMARVLAVAQAGIAAAAPPQAGADEPA
jgi:Uma2 family endonuclease